MPDFPENARRQHETHAEQTARRMLKHLTDLLDDLAHNRPPGSGWNIAVDAMSLYGQLTALGKHEELAARTGRAA